MRLIESYNKAIIIIENLQEKNNNSHDRRQVIMSDNIIISHLMSNIYLYQFMAKTASCRFLSVCELAGYKWVNL